MCSIESHVCVLHIQTDTHSARSCPCAQHTFQEQQLCSVSFPERKLLSTWRKISMGWNYPVCLFLLPKSQSSGKMCVPTYFFFGPSETLLFHPSYSTQKNQPARLQFQPASKWLVLKPWRPFFLNVQICSDATRTEQCDSFVLFVLFRLSIPGWYSFFFSMKEEEEEKESKEPRLLGVTQINHKLWSFQALFLKQGD